MRYYTGISGRDFDISIDVEGIGSTIGTDGGGRGLGSGVTAKGTGGGGA